MCSGAVASAKRRLAQAAECMQEVRPHKQQPTSEADSNHGVSEQFQEQLNQLLVALPQAATAAGTFTTFAQHAQRMLPGLTHISILLLPQDQPAAASTSAGINNNSSSSSSSGQVVGGDHSRAGGSKHNSKKAAVPAPQPTAAGVQQSKQATKGGNSTNSSSSGNSAAGRVAGNSSSGTAGNADGAASAAAASSSSSRVNIGLASEEVLATVHPGCQLEWSNCSLFQVFPEAPPQLLPPSMWPLPCTAPYHAVAVAHDVVSTQGDFAAVGPHFVDWCGWAEEGVQAMAAVPLSTCSRPAGVLSLGSNQEDALASKAALQLLGGVLAPYLHLLQLTTWRSDMQRRVSDLILPIAAQLAQQKNSQVSQLGCSVEEADDAGAAATATVLGPSPAAAAGAAAGAGLAAAAAGVGPGGGSSSATGDSNSSSSSSKAASRAKSGKGSTGASTTRSRAGPKRSNSSSSRMGGATGDAGCSSPTPSVVKAAGAGLGLAAGAGSGGSPLNVKRFESVVVQPQAAGALQQELELDWGDFVFNLVSMCIVYVYFSKAAVAGESLLAVTLCMGVAAFDIVLLVMRWLWFEQYITYGNLVLNLFQVYRVVVLPLANTWMAGSLLHKMGMRPGRGLVGVLGAGAAGCIVMGAKVRFLLHAPLQLASVLFAASSAALVCEPLSTHSSSLQCMGLVSGMQLTLGLVLPSAMVCYLDSRRGTRTCMPHMQAKRWLMPPHG